jgi:hypothetical protein
VKGACCDGFGAFGDPVCKTGLGGDFKVGVEYGSTGGDFSVGCPDSRSNYLGEFGTSYNAPSETKISVKVRVEAIKTGENNITIVMELGELGDNGLATCINELAVGGDCKENKVEGGGDGSSNNDIFSGAGMQAPSLLAALLFAIVIMN